MGRDGDAKPREDHAKTLMVTVSEKLDDKRDMLLEGIKLIPKVGGLLALFLGKLLPESRRVRLMKFVGQLKEALEFHSGDVSIDNADTEEFRYIVDEVFTAVAQSSTDAKLGYYRGILLNTLADPGSTSLDEKQMYLQLIRELSPPHLQVLGTFYAHQNDGLVGDHDLVRDLLRDFSDDQLRFIVRDLESRDLLDTTERAARFLGVPYRWSKPTERPPLPHAISLTLFCRGFLEFVLRR